MRMFFLGHLTDSTDFSYHLSFPQSLRALIQLLLGCSPGTTNLICPKWNDLLAPKLALLPVWPTQPMVPLPCCLSQKSGCQPGLFPLFSPRSIITMFQSQYLIYVYQSIPTATLDSSLFCLDYNHLWIWLFASVLPLVCLLCSLLEALWESPFPSLFHILEASHIPWFMIPILHLQSQKNYISLTIRSESEKLHLSDHSFRVKFLYASLFCFPLIKKKNHISLWLHLDPRII